MMNCKNDKKTVIIVDGHPIFRQGLAAILDEYNVEIVDCMGGENDIGGVCRNIRPEIAILDISPPGAGTVPMIQSIKAVEGTSLLILSECRDAEFVTKSVAYGCDAYLSKQIQGVHLKEALSLVKRGWRVFDQAAFAHVQEFLKLLLAQGNSSFQDTPRLTRREKEIVGLVSLGRSNKEIANELRLSPGTVKNIISNMLAHFHCGNRAQLAALAYRENFHPSPSHRPQK